MIGILVAVVQDIRVQKTDGTYAIKLRFTVDRKRYYIPLNVFLTPEDWEKTQSTSPRGKFRDYKYQFIEVQQSAEKIVQDMQVFSLEQVKRLLFNRGQNSDLISLISRYQEELRAEGRINTAKTFDSCKESFKKFGTNGKQKSIPLETVTPDWLNKYEKWMLREGKSVTTIGIYLRNLRTIYNIAIEDNLVPKSIYPFGKRKYQIPASENVKKALNLAQIKSIVEYEPVSESEARARDLWVFSYLCNGMNVKDMAHLRYSDIDGDRISFFRAKTKGSTKQQLKPVVVYLMPMSKEIIQRWGQPRLNKNSLVFDLIDLDTDLEKQAARIRQAAKTINKYMERIGEKLEIPVKITTYTARHSYATVLKRSGASLEMISESLGHKDLKTTENYLDSFEDDVKRDFQQRLIRF